MTAKIYPMNQDSKEAIRLYPEANATELTEANRKDIGQLFREGYARMQRELGKGHKKIAYWETMDQLAQIIYKIVDGKAVPVSVDELNTFYMKPVRAAGSAAVKEKARIRREAREAERRSQPRTQLTQVEREALALVEAGEAGVVQMADVFHERELALVEQGLFSEAPQPAGIVATRVAHGGRHLDQVSSAQARKQSVDKMDAQAEAGSPRRRRMAHPLQPRIITPGVKFRDQEKIDHYYLYDELKKGLFGVLVGATVELPFDLEEEADWAGRTLSAVVDELKWGRLRNGGRAYMSKRDQNILYVSRLPAVAEAKKESKE